jgi:glucose/arabinose dehydrogenase
MPSRRFYVALALLVTSLLGALLTTGVNPKVEAAAALPSIVLSSPIGGFSQPVVITHANDGSGRLFVVEQPGRIRIIKNGALLATSFLDISARITSGGERGTLGLAFPPGFSAKQYFYVFYTNLAGDIAISRFRVSAANADVADAASEQIVLTIPHPTNANHNGGQMAFSQRDGFLYIGVGDGGAGNDPPNNAQNPTQLLGKLLRIDVETGRPTTYNIPATNPFATSTDVRREIWALGLRNPWRFSFDRLTNDLYIADVGQNAIEEVNFQLATSPGGENYGWRVFEGTQCTGLGPAPCTPGAYTPPVVQYSHSFGCSVTGGYVYRGATYARMQGLFFYGDFCSGRIWGMRQESGAWQTTELLDTAFSISTFGEDEAGNLYVADYATGTIYNVTDNVPPADLGVTATDVPDPVAPDQNISYTVTVTNNSAGGTTNARLNVPLNNTLLFQAISIPAGWTCLTPPVNGGASFTCTAATVAAGATSTFIIELKAAQSQFGANDQTITQNFNVASDQTDPNNINDSVNVTTAYVTPHVVPKGWAVAANSSATEDESNPARLAYTNSTAAADSGSPAGTYVLRYNILASDGLASAGSAYTRLRVRFRDEGAGSQVTAVIKSSNLSGGLATLGTIFDSNAFIPVTGFQTREVTMPVLTFNFAQNSYWLEVTLTKDSTSNQPAFGLAQINQQ